MIPNGRPSPNEGGGVVQFEKSTVPKLGDKFNL